MFGLLASAIDAPLDGDGDERNCIRIVRFTGRAASQAEASSEVAVDTTSTDHGICVSAVDSHRRRESGDGEEPRVPTSA